MTGTPEPKKSVFESVIKSIIAKNVKGTEEYKEEQINARDKRIAKHEKKITEIIRTIADRQEKEVLGKVKKAVKTDIPQLDTGKYGALYYSLLKNTYIEIYDEEGNASMTQVGVDTAFKV